MTAQHGIRPKRLGRLICMAAATLLAGTISCSTNSKQQETDGPVELHEVEAAEKSYVGSEACMECHQEIYDKWKKTLHARMMQDAKRNPDAILGDLTQSIPFSREDISYTLGSHWTQRYMTEIDGEYYVLPRMWSIQSEEWLPYSIFSWKKKPWRMYCAGCHTTGFDADTGGFAEISIGCEACHGPSALHLKDPAKPGATVNPAKLDKERSLMVCESCHVRGRDNGNSDYCFPLQYLPGDDLSATYTPLDIAQGENVARALHRLYDEWKEKVSQPEGTSCEMCQNFRTPNKTTEKAYDLPGSSAICYTCHGDEKGPKEHSRHPEEVECSDCHVPTLAKSGGSQDIHSHKFQFQTPSKYLPYAECYETRIEDSCSACHSDKSTNWAIHSISNWKIRPYKKLHKVGD